MDYFAQKRHHRQARKSKLRKTNRKEWKEPVGRSDNRLPKSDLPKSGRGQKNRRMKGKDSEHTISSPEFFTNGRQTRKCNRTFCLIETSEVASYANFEQIGAHYELSDAVGAEQSNNAPAIAKCAICLEVLPVTKLMKNCSHPAACQACLRELYVNQAQTDVANYPLKCFHPSCNLTVRDTQLIKHSLIHKQSELTKHHRLTILSKSHSGSKKAVHCPTCDHPSIRAKTGAYFVTCKECKARYHAENDDLLSLGVTDFKILKRFRVCGRCGSVVEHSGGCYKMKCRCGYRFCFACGSENAQCGHTPADHGFIDNVTGYGDFEGLDKKKSYT